MNMPRDTGLPADGPSQSIGEHLRALGALRPGDEASVLAEQQRSGLPFGEAALRLGLIDRPRLAEALARQHAYPWPLPGGQVSRQVVSALLPHSPLAEVFRDLRTRLLAHWRSPVTEARALAVVSTERGDGRSMVAANLAACLAQARLRTLLIDLDLRQPVQHQWFGRERVPGVTGLLIGRCTLAQALDQPPHPQLSVLAAGALPPNPQELLGPGALGLLMASLRSRFDVIVADTSAWCQASDAQCVASLCGQALLVTRQQVTSLDTARSLLEGLGASGTEVLGAFANRH